MTLSADISDFGRRDIAVGGKTKPVLLIGDVGPAVIVIHEAWGFTPGVARLCRWIAAAGFRVYAPVLFGPVGASSEETIKVGTMVGICISRGINMFAANRSSRVTVWLRALARLAHAECGGAGVGAMGMCLSGGFALSMAVDPVMLAPVIANPGPPALTAGGLDISPQDLQVVRERTRTEGLTLLGYRFEGDTICKPAKFETLRTVFGPAFVATELPDSCAKPVAKRMGGQGPHAVFTSDLIDAPGERTRMAVDEIIAFFGAKLKTGEGVTI